MCMPFFDAQLVTFTVAHACINIKDISNTSPFESTGLDIKNFVSEISDTRQNGKAKMKQRTEEKKKRKSNL